MLPGMKVRLLTYVVIMTWLTAQTAFGQLNMSSPFPANGMRSNNLSTMWDSIPGAASPVAQAPLLNAWGLDVLISDGGFGLGTFYRREFTEDLFGFVTFSISESKDEREVERFDQYLGVSFVPGKLNRFLVLPLMFGVQHRLFREDIVDTFRPYVNGGAGPTMIFAAPFTEIVTNVSGVAEFRQVEFFKSLGKGQPHYTAGAFIGVGANFGSEKSNVFGVNFRYYFNFLFGDGLPSLFNTSDGTVAATKKNFGGFFITLNVGMAY